MIPVRGASRPAEFIGSRRSPTAAVDNGGNLGYIRSPEAAPDYSDWCYA